MCGKSGKNILLKMDVFEPFYQPFHFERGRECKNIGKDHQLIRLLNIFSGSKIPKSALEDLNCDSFE
jgi:hypothetical protein